MRNPRGSPGSKHLALYLLILLIAQLAAHFFIQAVQPNSRLFLNISANLLHHGTYSFDGTHQTRMIQPLYTLFVLLFYQLPGGHPSLVVMAQIFMNLLGFVLTLRIAERVYSREGSPRLLPLVLVLDFAIWIFALYMINEALFIFLSICTIYFLTSALESGRMRDFALSGLFLGLDLLTRPAAIGLIAAITLLFILGWRQIRRPALGWSVTILAFALVCAPWTIRNGLAMGKFTPLSSEDSYHLLYSSLPDSVTSAREYTIFDQITTEPDRIADSLNLYRTALRNIMTDPAGFVSRGVGKVTTVWYHFPGTREWSDWRLKLPSLIVQWAILGFAVLGALNTRWPFSLALLTPALGITLLVFFTYATTRFTVPALPFLLILTARGLEVAWGAVGRVLRAPH